eukprot:Gb_33130 [translate_table: standard]
MAALPVLEATHKRQRLDTTPSNYEEDFNLAKRCCSEDWRWHDVLSEFLCMDDDAQSDGSSAHEDQNVDPVQEVLVFNVMRTLAEEIKWNSNVYWGFPDEICTGGCSVANDPGQNWLQINTWVDNTCALLDSDHVNPWDTCEDGCGVNMIHYLMMATDDELGIPPSPLSNQTPLDGNEDCNIFYDELFENLSTSAIDETAEHHSQQNRADLWSNAEGVLANCYS